MRPPTLFIAVLLACSRASPAQEEIRPQRGPELWISRQQIQSLPDSGPEWERVLFDAERTFVPAIADKEDKTDTYVMAASMVWLREGTGDHRERVRAACRDVTLVTPPAENDPPNEFSLAWSRNLTGYVIAAGLVGLTPADDASFKRWLAAALPHLGRVHRSRPNNIGTHAGTARVAAAIYLDDTAEEQAAWDVFRRWLGDDTSPFNFAQADWGGSECSWAWQGEPYPYFFGINRVGTSEFACARPPHAYPFPPILRDIAGALPDDQRRGDGEGCACPPVPGTCCFSWPPRKTNYVYEALQGVLAQAVMHSRRGRDPWFIAPDPSNGHGAILRAFEWLRNVASHPIGDPLNGHDDYWQAYIVNQVYGMLPAFVALDELTTVSVGKSVGYADWTTLDPSWP